MQMRKLLKAAALAAILGALAACSNPFSAPGAGGAFNTGGDTENPGTPGGTGSGGGGTGDGYVPGLSDELAYDQIAVRYPVTLGLSLDGRPLVSESANNARTVFPEMPDYTNGKIMYTLLKRSGSGWVETPIAGSPTAKHTNRAWDSNTFLLERGIYKIYVNAWYDSGSFDGTAAGSLPEGPDGPDNSNQKGAATRTGGFEFAVNVDPTTGEPLAVDEASPNFTVPLIGYTNGTGILGTLRFRLAVPSIGTWSSVSKWTTSVTPAADMLAVDITNLGTGISATTPTPATDGWTIAGSGPSQQLAFDSTTMAPGIYAISVRAYKEDDTSYKTVTSVNSSDVPSAGDYKITGAFYYETFHLYNGATITHNVTDTAPGASLAAATTGFVDAAYGRIKTANTRLYRIKAAGFRDTASKWNGSYSMDSAGTVLVDGATASRPGGVSNLAVVSSVSTDDLKYNGSVWINLPPQNIETGLTANNHRSSAKIIITPEDDGAVIGAVGFEELGSGTGFSASGGNPASIWNTDGSGDKMYINTAASNLSGSHPLFVVVDNIPFALNPADPAYLPELKITLTAENGSSTADYYVSLFQQGVTVKEVKIYGSGSTTKVGVKADNNAVTRLVDATNNAVWINAPDAVNIDSIYHNAAAQPGYTINTASQNAGRWLGVRILGTNDEELVINSALTAGFTYTSNQDGRPWDNVPLDLQTYKPSGTFDDYSLVSYIIDHDVTTDPAYPRYKFTLDPASPGTASLGLLRFTVQNAAYKTDGRERYDAIYDWYAGMIRMQVTPPVGNLIVPAVLKSKDIVGTFYPPYAQVSALGTIASDVVWEIKPALDTGYPQLSFADGTSSITVTETGVLPGTLAKLVYGTGLGSTLPPNSAPQPINAAITSAMHDHVVNRILIHSVNNDLNIRSIPEVVRIDRDSSVTGGMNWLRPGIKLTLTGKNETTANTDHGAGGLGNNNLWFSINTANLMPAASPRNLESGSINVTVNGIPVIVNGAPQAISGFFLGDNSDDYQFGIDHSQFTGAITIEVSGKWDVYGGASGTYIYETLPPVRINVSDIGGLTVGASWTTP
jgi:hypothetical protein